MINEQSKTLDKDPAFQAYIDHLKDNRDNNGEVSKGTLYAAHSALRNFCYYTDLEITETTLTKLIQHKRRNKESKDIEEQLRAFSNVEPMKSHHTQASRILGMFAANFANLDLRINTHFEPASEDCTEGIFREIYSQLTPEQQDMIQWNLYYPQRAQPAYRIPLNEIDVSRKDYAIITIKPHHANYSNKARVKHPAIIPLKFAKRVIANADAAHRKAVFPNHVSQWKKITAFAKQEYNVKLTSKYCRKLYEDKAEDSTLKPSIAAFLMGDKTKLQQTGHLPQFYNLKLKFIEKIIADYKQSGIEELLTMPNNKHLLQQTPNINNNSESIEELKQQIAELTNRLQQMTSKRPNF